MSEKEINIKSSTIEKGLELAKEFLGKLVSPTIEEVGLLLSDHVKYFRFKNQVRILLKAKSYVEEKKVPLKTIPTKVLVPLLENASLEDDETLQDKWAKMLANMVDSEKNLQNKIFPYILSQLSIEEFEELKELLIKEEAHRETQKELEKWKAIDHYPFRPETKRIQREVDSVEQSGFWIELEEFERANLLRLGLIRQLPPKIYIQEFKTSGSHYDSKEEWHKIDAEYDPNDYGYRITELGIKFIDLCS